MKKHLYATLLCSLFATFPAIQVAAAPAARIVFLTKNTPYSAEQFMETSRIQASGGQMSSTSSSRIYRDSEGRERTESLDASGAVRRITFRDSDGNTYVLDPATRQAYKLNASIPASVPTPALTTTTTTRKDLGVRDIEGVASEGSETTTVRAADEAANRPATTHTSETWRSRELGVSMLSKSTSPAFTFTTGLRNVRRDEPPAELMTDALAGYTIVPPPAPRIFVIPGK
ncbi:MAG: hypothetical protein ABIT83_14455 [Massilia sp.]